MVIECDCHSIAKPSEFMQIMVLYKASKVKAPKKSNSDMLIILPIFIL